MTYLKQQSTQLVTTLLFTCLLVFSSCNSAKEMPHATPEELLTSMFECVQQDDEASFLTLLPTKVESIAIVENFKSAKGRREKDLLKIEENWDEQDKASNEWGRELFAKLQDPLVGKIDLDNAKLNNIKSHIVNEEELYRGYAEAEIISDKAGIIAVYFATQAGPDGNYTLTPTLSFSAGTVLLEHDQLDSLRSK